MEPGESNPELLYAIQGVEQSSIRTKWEDHMLLSLKCLAQCAVGACLLSSLP